MIIKEHVFHFAQMYKNTAQTINWKSTVQCQVKFLPLSKLETVYSCYVIWTHKQSSVWYIFSRKFLGEMKKLVAFSGIKEVGGLHLVEIWWENASNCSTSRSSIFLTLTKNYSQSRVKFIVVRSGHVYHFFQLRNNKYIITNYVK